MLLLHQLAKRAGAAHNFTLDLRAPADSCNDINCRRLFNIVWGCLAIVFACTQVSVHTNVPPPDQS
ncbi:hypothetical protein B0H17DRAFT_925620 [Mycena rosella]|uniref:Uncharacterized protein n=1 Tax=Mycena rosella TaxID=1033263 RepID=A0AAD7GQN2_MYCRO|nr:hypothetical protein B0H17DRAFT_925620 [Mycena rosella]